MTAPGRLLVVGGGGQLGRGLRRVAGAQGGDLRVLGHGDLDITDTVAVADAVDEAAPTESDAEPSDDADLASLEEEEPEATETANTTQQGKQR